MTTLEVGKRIAELCRQNKNVDAVNELYDAKIVSLEAMSMPGFPQRMEGIEPIRKKNEWWLGNHDIHSTTVSGPFPNGEQFILHMKADVTPKVGPKAGKRMQSEEVGLYTVKNGKVVQEQFFYDMEG